MLVEFDQQWFWGHQRALHSMHHQPKLRCSVWQRMELGSIWIGKWWDHLWFSHAGTLTDEQYDLPV